MKIVERPDYAYCLVCIWVGMFTDEAELDRRALEVLASAYQERDYDFASALEIGLGLRRPSRRCWAMISVT